ncbi:hypothetical protein [Streptomyces sp. NPDC054958]
MLERIASRVGRQSAGALRDDGTAPESVATALGTTYSKALILLLTAQDRQRHAPQRPHSSGRPGPEAWPWSRWSGFDGGDHDDGAQGDDEVENADVLDLVGVLA